MESNNFSKDMYIAHNCEIKGEIVSSGNVTVDGKAEGKISIKGNLIVGESGMIKADIEADNVEIKGQVHGKMTVKNLLDINSTGVLHDDITTQFLKIDQGAKFIGKSTHPDAETEKNSNDSKFAFKPIVYNRLAK